MQPIISAEGMRRAEQQAVEAGGSLQQLMQQAGRSVASVVAKHFPMQPVLVLAGTGNNGGDGYIAAAALQQLGWPVTVALMQDVLDDDREPSEEAVKAAQQCRQSGAKVTLFHPELIKGHGVIIDAIFGIGLNRPLPESLLEVFALINDSDASIVAIDMPSGLNSDTAQLMGGALPAALTVVLGAYKRAHVLLPGKVYCGALELVPIDVDEETLQRQATAWLNTPGLWQDTLPEAESWQHKYDRGHAGIIAGGELIGATRLMATAAMRCGCGMTTVIAAPGVQAQLLNATLPASLLVRTSESAGGMLDFAAQYKITSLAWGPGAGSGYRSKQMLEALLGQERPVVLDADGLQVLAANREDMLAKTTAPLVLTPHRGEFASLFEEFADLDKTAAAVAAAKLTGAVVVFKGSDTVIASPEGQVAISAEAPAWLATAGSGDVLAGIIAGLLATDMPLWEAACAGVWLHSMAAQKAGLNMVADDLQQYLPSVWQQALDEID